MSTGRILARNTAFNAAGRLWEALLALLITPYVVYNVGLPAYGVWALLAAYTGYVALFDFGISSAYTKYIAEHAARRDYDAASAVVSTGFFFYLVLGVALVAVGWPLAGLVANLLSRYGVLRDEIVGDALFLFRWGLALWAAASCVSAFTSVQTGLQRMDVTNVISFGLSLVKVAGIVLFLETGHGVRGLLFANAAAFGVFAVASVACAFWLMPQLRVSLTRVTWPTWRILFRFGWRAQVSRLSNLITFETDKVVVGFISGGTDLVALYELGVSLANKMRQVPMLLLTALLPAAADLDAREEHERLRWLYMVSSKYVAAMTVPLVLFTVGSAGPIMRLWMGQGFDTAAWVLRVIAFGYLANILPGAGVSIVLGKGRPDIQMHAGLIAMVSNIALTVALYFRVGFWGIPIATALSMFISWAWFGRAVGAILGVRPMELFKTAVLWPAVASLPGFVLCLVMDWFSGGYPGRLTSGVFVILGAVVFFQLYLLTIRATPFLDAFDADFLADTLKLGRVPIVRNWLRKAHHG